MKRFGNEEGNIGKLKQTLKERCPQCGELLQVRIVKEKGLIKGEEVIFDKEFILCRVCGHIKKKDKYNYR